MFHQPVPAAARRGLRAGERVLLPGKLQHPRCRAGGIRQENIIDKGCFHITAPTSCFSGAS